uniref:Uncharacterized protein n=1 Tax=Octopus bimaculoides TaxID=37653 RepID=A0A0L8HTF2_OCTBM
MCSGLFRCGYFYCIESALCRMGAMPSRAIFRVLYIYIYIFVNPKVLVMYLSTYFLTMLKAPISIGIVSDCCCLYFENFVL